MSKPFVEPYPSLDDTCEQLLAAKSELETLRSQLAAAVAANERAQSALNLRNAALDAATTHFMIVDARQQRRPIVYVNRALALQYGYGGPDDLIGQSVAVISDAIAEDARAAMQQAFVEGRTAAIEGQVVRRGGGTFWTGFTTTPLRNECGEITHYVTLGADITARRESVRKERELQQQLRCEVQERERVEIELRLAQKLESIGRFAAGLAHEINTPIQYVGDSVHFLQSAFDELSTVFLAYRAAIKGLAGEQRHDALLADLAQIEKDTDFQFLSQEVPKAFERSLEGADRVAGIVRAMREFAYPHGEEHVAADLNQALLTTLTVARSEYKYAAHVETHLGELPPVICNLGELNQVFLNLIVNAAHAIQDSDKDACTGCITISTSCAQTTAQITIADNGCGIPAENLQRIFDPFFTTKEVGRGTGQGLAIARSIVVDKHGGRIDVSSTPGVGTQFVIQLPLQGRSAPAVA